MKRKIVVMFIISLLVGIQASSIAGAGSVTSEKNDKIPVQIASVTTKGVVKTETIFLTEKELLNFKESLSVLTEQIQSTKNLNLENIVDKLFGDKYPVLYSFFKTLLKIRLSRTKVFVVSQGSGFNFNPFAQNELKMKKKFVFWHYSPDQLSVDKTVILQPLTQKMKVLTGRQIGFMTEFTGVYIFDARSYPEMSHTFFMGVAKHATGIQLEAS